MADKPTAATTQQVFRLQLSYPKEHHMHSAIGEILKHDSEEQPPFKIVKS